MADRGELEALFLAHRDVIARLAASVGRRQGLRGDDLDDFGAWVNARIIERDYAVLDQVRDERAMVAYLSVSVANLAREYRVLHWGRWRPSAAARRQGPVAMRLELLVHRDGLRLDEATQVLRSAGLTTLSDRDLAAVLAACPPRTAARPGRGSDVDAAADGDALPDADAHADARVLDAEAEAERRSLGGQLAAAVDALPAEDRVMVRLRYWKGLSVADVARALGVPQKPLYRRLDRLLAGLRQELGRRGVGQDAVYALLGAPRPPEPDELALLSGGRPPRPPGGMGPAGDPRPPPDRDFGRSQPSL